jgi:hypothetical protein
MLFWLKLKLPSTSRSTFVVVKSQGNQKKITRRIWPQWYAIAIIRKKGKQQKKNKKILGTQFCNTP